MIRPELEEKSSPNRLVLLKIFRLIGENLGDMEQMKRQVVESVLALAPEAQELERKDLDWVYYVLCDKHDPLTTGIPLSAKAAFEVIKEIDQARGVYPDLQLSDL